VHIDLVGRHDVAPHRVAVLVQVPHAEIAIARASVSENRVGRCSTTCSGTPTRLPAGFSFLFFSAALVVAGLVFWSFIFFPPSPLPPLSPTPPPPPSTAVLRSLLVFFAANDAQGPSAFEMQRKKTTTTAATTWWPRRN